MNTRFACGIATFAAVVGLQSTAHATFHLMQIEELIVSVNGDTTAQAIQLRMRSNGQRFVSESRLVVVNANGENPISVLDIDGDVPNGSTGDHVLIASATFPGHSNPTAIPDFFLTNLIPESYFAAGSLMFLEDEGDTVYWRLSWGGAAYTGPTTGSTTNDLDGEFGPAFGTGLPSCGAYVLRFRNGATARSTNNAADYRLQPEQAATFVNNAGDSFLVTAPLPSVRIQTVDANAAEAPATDTGRLRVVRTTTCTQVALSVRYGVGGTATNGQDYQMLSGMVNIPAAATMGNVTVRAINDAAPEADETVIGTLSPNAAYTIGAPNSGTVTIHSNE